MTELSDYRRLVEEPHLAKLDAKIAGMSAELDRLTKERDAAQGNADANYRRWVEASDENERLRWVISSIATTAKADGNTSLAAFCRNAAKPGGDLIDYGWSIARELHERGFDIVPRDRGPAGLDPATTINEMCSFPATPKDAR